MLAEGEIDWRCVSVAPTDLCKVVSVQWEDARCKEPHTYTCSSLIAFAICCKWNETMNWTRELMATSLFNFIESDFITVHSEGVACKRWPIIRQAKYSSVLRGMGNLLSVRVYSLSV